MYILSADGACSGNPGNGGWAFEVFKGALSADALLFGASHGSPATTNNIMEMTAVLEGLRMLQSEGMAPGKVTLRLDSQYVLNGIFDWMANWKKKNWMGSNGPVANRPIWEAIDSEIRLLSHAGFTFEKQWIRGHSGDFANERVDKCAVHMRDAFASARADRKDWGPEGPFEAPKAVDLEDISSNEPIDVLNRLLKAKKPGKAGLEGLLRALRENKDLLFPDESPEPNI